MREKLSEPDKLVDDVAQRVLDVLGKPRPVHTIRHSHIISAIVGTTGLALFLVGVEKVFVTLGGWASIGIGLLLLALSGALFTKLK